MFNKSIYYDPARQPSYLGNIRINVSKCVYKGGVSLNVDELFKVAAYEINTKGYVHPEFNLEYKIHHELEPSTPLDSRFRRMREILNQQKDIVFYNANYGRLYVRPGKYTINSQFNSLIFSVRLVLVPPPIRHRYDEIYLQLQFIKEDLAKFQEFADNIANEVQGGLLLAEEVLDTQSQFLEPFESLRSLVSAPFAIAARTEQIILGLGKVGVGAFTSLFEGLTFDSNLFADKIEVPVGHITPFYRTFLAVPVKDKVGAVLMCGCMMAMVNEHIKAKHKVLRDLENARKLLEDVERKIRSHLNSDLLDRYRRLRLQFDRIIKSGAFDIEGQTVLAKGTRKPVIISYFEEMETLDGFYDLENYNYIHDYFFGEYNDELIYGIS